MLTMLYGMASVPIALCIKVAFIRFSALYKKKKKDKFGRLGVEECMGCLERVRSTICGGCDLNILYIN